jgi:hypothetical protein
MNFDPFLAWLESTAVSRWVLESPSIAFGFPGILVAHAIGMGLAAGLSIVLDLRILGVAHGIPLGEMRRSLPVLWFGFWLNAASGLLLLIGYPTKALTNPVFYVKLLLIAGGIGLLRRITREIDTAVHRHGHGDGEGERDSGGGPPLKWMALASIVCWTGAITAGRLLAYTYSRLTVNG